MHATLSEVKLLKMQNNAVNRNFVTRLILLQEKKTSFFKQKTFHRVTVLQRGLQ